MWNLRLTSQDIMIAPFTDGGVWYDTDAGIKWRKAGQNLKPLGQIDNKHISRISG